MAQSVTPVDMSRVEFVADNILIGSRVYRAGDIADIPTDRLKELGNKVKSSDKNCTSFEPKPNDDKPKK